MAADGEEYKKARLKALQLLEHMDRTEKGLTQRLAQAGFSGDAVWDAVAYVKSFGYIDDARYARHYISCRLGEKSRQRLLQELLQKGVDRQTALQAWEEAAGIGEPDERAMIRRAVEKKCRPGSEPDKKEMRRLYGYLARRGFRESDISAALEEMGIACSYESRW